MTPHELQYYYAMRTYLMLFRVSGIEAYAKQAIAAKKALKALQGATKTIKIEV